VCTAACGPDPGTTDTPASVDADTGAASSHTQTCILPILSSLLHRFDLVISAQQNQKKVFAAVCAKLLHPLAILYQKHAEVCCLCLLPSKVSLIPLIFSFWVSSFSVGCSDSHSFVLPSRLLCCRHSFSTITSQTSPSICQQHSLSRMVLEGHQPSHSCQSNMEAIPRERRTSLSYSHHFPGFMTKKVVFTLKIVILFYFDRKLRDTRH
jgi:hypothetical protein